MSLVSKEELFKFLNENLTNKLILDQLTRIVDQVETHKNDVASFLKWINDNRHLKIADFQVPKHILQNAWVSDIRIQSRGPDDIIFDKNPDIRAKIARGTTILEYSDSDDKKKSDLVIYGLRKFTGGLGDEDEVDRDAQEWKKYFLKDFEETKHVKCLRKANGEAAHLSCRWINDQFILIAGSKNVHLVFRNSKDLEEYTEQRFTFASIIAQVIAGYLEKMEPDFKNLFLSFLSITKFTCIFELLQPNNQHVEDLSYLTEPDLKFITFTDNRILEKPTSLCCMLPDYSLEIASLFKLDCVECKTIEFNEVNDFLIQVRKGYAYEGYVVYFIDSELNVIGILKKKTAWYIILRAVREKLRSFLSARSNGSVYDLQKRITTRLKEIRKWIGFSEQDLEKWTVLCVEFADWFNDSLNANKISKDDYAQRFPVIWKKYLKETNRDDKIDLNLNDS